MYMGMRSSIQAKRIFSRLSTVDKRVLRKCLEAFVCPLLSSCTVGRFNERRKKESVSAQHLHFVLYPEKSKVLTPTYTYCRAKQRLPNMRLPAEAHENTHQEMFPQRLRSLKLGTILFTLLCTSKYPHQPGLHLHHHHLLLVLLFILLSAL